MTSSASSRVARLAATGLAVAALAAAFELACGGPDSHVLSGRRYLADRDCVEGLTSVDVVEGPDPGRECDPQCIVGQSPLLDGGSAIYVTTQCPPYPPTFDLSGSNVACPGALAAFERKDFCKPEGSTNPRDAGEDAADASEDAADASEDAADASETSDAGEDASSDAALDDASEPSDADSLDAADATD